MNPLTLGWIYFFACALFGVIGALITVVSANPIRGAMGLLLMIVGMAGLYLSLHAQFLAAIQLIVYAGAIVVLFLFVIMLLGPDAHARAKSDKRGRLTRSLGAGLLGLIGFFMVALFFVTSKGAKPAADVPSQGTFGNIEGFGKVLFSEGLLAFELSSALLIVAIVSAIAIAKGKRDLLSSKNSSTFASSPSSTSSSSLLLSTPPSSAQSAHLSSTSSTQGKVATYPDPSSSFEESDPTSFMSIPAHIVSVREDG